MANKEHLDILARGVEYWNDWIAKERMRLPGRGVRHEGARIGTSFFCPDFREADLRGRDLYQGKTGAGWSGIDLIGADLREAQLGRTNLSWANLTASTLQGADLEGTFLNSSRFDGANLSTANLTDANISGCNFLMANLRGTQFRNAYLASTIFSDSDLTGATGLESCKHGGPSTLDYRTLLTYGLLPIAFLHGCGLPDDFIRYVLTSHAATQQFYSCFVSHSEKDHHFVSRLLADLESRGVRGWLAEKDLLFGAKMLETFHAEIANNQRLILVCSVASTTSGWVEDEVNSAFALEREQSTSIIIPIRIDDSILHAKEGWAAKLRHDRHIGNFTRWSDPEAYRIAFDQLLKSLKRPADS